jgi:gluconolactonase
MYYSPRPVQELQSEVFASLPDSFRGIRPPTPWIQVQRGGKHADCVFEGPAFLRDGSLLVSDIPWGRIFRISPEGSMDLVIDYDGEPNGIAVRPDGMAAVADMHHGVMLLNPAAGTIEPLQPRAEIEGFKGVSDLVYASTGDLYFTDQGLTGMHDPTGRAYRLGTDGRLTRLIGTIPSPNGIVIDAANEVLYIAATRANAVWRAPLLPNGDVTKVGIHVQLSGGHGPDGLALDTEGNLAVAHVGAGRVFVFSPHGDLLAVVESATGPTITNVAFGIEPGWMYMTEAESGTVLRAPWPHAAQPQYSHQK